MPPGKGSLLALSNSSQPQHSKRITWYWGVNLVKDVPQAPNFFLTFNIAGTIHLTTLLILAELPTVPNHPRLISFVSLPHRRLGCPEDLPSIAQLQ